MMKYKTTLMSSILAMSLTGGLNLKADVDPLPYIEIQGNMVCHLIILSNVNNVLRYTYGNCTPMPGTEIGGHGTDEPFYGGSGGSSSNPNPQEHDSEQRDPDSEKECTANPIIISTGNKIQPELDYLGKGEFPLSIKRTYNNFSNSIGLFGSKWVTEFSGKVIDSGDEMLVTRPSGGNLLLKYNSNSNLWEDNPEAPLFTLEKTQALQYILKSSTGITETYGGVGKKLLKVENASGISHTYSYNGYGLYRITHSSQRYLQFNWSGGKVNKITDSSGNQYLYQYNSSGLLNKATMPGSPSTIKEYLYNDSRHFGALTQININGKKYGTYSYHADGRAYSSSHWMNDSAEVERSELTYSDFETVVKNPLGHKNNYYYQDLNGIRLLDRVDRQYSTNCPAASRDISYDSKGRTDTKIDWKGSITDYTYNSSNQLVKTIKAKNTPEQEITDYLWVAGKSKVSQITKADSKVNHYYLTNGRLDYSVTTNLGSYGSYGETRKVDYSYSHHSNGLLSQMVIDGPRTDVNDKITYNYDTKGNLTSIVNALGHSVVYSNYDALGNARRMTSPNGLVVDYTYDARGKVLTQKVYHPAGTQTTSFQYNPMGQVTKVTLPDGNYIHNEYDQAFRLTKTIDRNGAYIYYSRNANSDVISKKIVEETTRLTLPPGGCWDGPRIAKSIAKANDFKTFYYCDLVEETVLENKKVENFQYDAMGRLQKALGSNGQVTDYDYDNNSNISAMKDSYGRVTSYTHDGLNRVKTVKDNKNGVTSYTYDVAGRVKTVTDARGLTTTYNYSGFGELEELISPDTGITSYDYNKSGQVTRIVRNDGATTSFSYDVLGRLSVQTDGSTSKRYYYDSGTYRMGRLYYVNDASGQTIYWYDKVGNVTRKKSTINGAGYNTYYSYDGMNRVISMTYPTGRKVLYSYDNMGRVSQVRYQNGSTITNVATNLKYRPFGPMSEMTHGNGAIRKITHDLDYRPTSIFTSGLQSLSYQFDNNNNITKITNAYNTSSTQNYVYDSLNRLKSSSSSATGSIVYDYDAVGNRTKRYKNNVIQESNTYSSSSNQQTKVNSSNVTYNSNGHTRTKSGATFNYNVENRFSSHIKSGVTTSFKHNALGQRVLKSGGSTGTNYFFYDEAGQLIAEYALTGKIWKEYIYLGGQVIGFVRNGAVYYVHNDHLGRAERITNASKGTVWKANNNDFDRVVTANSIGGYNLGFPGQYWDQETGLYYNYFRDYDPSTGRYIQSDPIGLRAGVNTYAYVAANPVKYIDPYGLYCGPTAGHEERMRRGDHQVAYSYGSYVGGSLIVGGGPNAGVNGQFFSDGSVGSYAVVGGGLGYDVGTGAEFNFAVHTGDGGADSWSGGFSSVHLSLGGFTGSIFWGGGWFGISGGISSDGIAGSAQGNIYKPITQSDAESPNSCSCDK